MGFWDGSGISWSICKQSASRSTQITTHHSISTDRMLFLTTNRQCQALKTARCIETRSSAIAEGPRDASCQLKSCQLPLNSAETTYTTSPDQIDGMKLEI